jgi:radical SAM/Cys-rich protein
MEKRTRYKSMKAFGERFANADEQLKIINQPAGMPLFDVKFESIGIGPLTSGKIEIFQVNVGKMCNQVCKHCHVDAAPDRKEIMIKTNMELCLSALASSDILTVDITGGAPEMNPYFKWFVSEIKKMRKHIIVRSNLTILVANGFEDYPEFMAENNVEIISSLPFYKSSLTDKQRGEGVFEKSVTAIKILNNLGYGKENSGLIFNLVYNPAGAFLPGSQLELEKEYKRELLKNYGLVFNNLFAITNMPVSRFLDFLISSGNYKEYMEKLCSSFNPGAAKNVMCKFTLSVGWDGKLYDCDFNQMLELNLNNGTPKYIKDFNISLLENRRIITGQHCYGCTAGAGSSCGGTTA